MTRPGTCIVSRREESCVIVIIHHSQVSMYGTKCCYSGALIGTVMSQSVCLSVCLCRDYTRPDLPSGDADISAALGGHTAAVPDISTALAGMHVG